MKTVLLTTDTTHHRYYAWRVHERFPWHTIVIERKCLKAPFETAHPFEQERDHYEQAVLLKGAPPTFEALAQTIHVDSVNDSHAREGLSMISADVIFVFGAGRLKRPLIDMPSLRCINLHGGNPEYYRGLDSHLWAIYQGAFDQLITTLHDVDESLDSGDIIFQAPLSIPQGCPLYQLRAINTEVCVDLSMRALASLVSEKGLSSRVQYRAGAYYSFMPSSLKEECVRKFAAYTAHARKFNEVLH